MAKQFVYSSIFGELTKIVQVVFDKVSQQHKQLFDNVIFENYLDWDTPTISLNFEEIIGIYNMTIAAATIDDNSKAPTIRSNAPAVLAQRVLNHAIQKNMTAQTFRRIMELRSNNMLDDRTRTDALIRLMWGDVRDVVNGVLARLDLIFLEALSNEGVLRFTDRNNPEGPIRTTIDYNMPEGNKLSASTDWTADNYKEVDVLVDVLRVVEAARNKVTFEKILCSPDILYYILATRKFRRAVFGTDKMYGVATVEDLNNYMRSKGLPVFESVMRQVRVIDHGETSDITPWNVSNLVFVPAGKLGVIKNAYSDSEMGMTEPGVTYSNYNRIRVSQWGVGETQGANAAQFTKAQVYALPVITEINGIYSLATGYNPVASGTDTGGDDSEAEGASLTPISTSAIDEAFESK